MIPPSPPLQRHDDPLRQQIEDLWAARDRFIAEFGDPSEVLDRFAEEMFGTPEAAAVLVDYLRATAEGRRSDWLTGDDECREPD